MGVKEASIVAGLLGGAGGAGAAYATDNFGYGFGKSITPREDVDKLLDCTKFSDFDTTTSLPTTTPADPEKEITWKSWDFVPKKGCLKTSISNDKKKLNVELLTVGEAENGISTGMVVLSTLSDLDQDANDAAVVSRVFRVTKSNSSSKWVPQEGVEFTSKISVKEGKINGFGDQNPISIKDLCKSDSNKCAKKFEWKTGGDKKDSIVGKLTLHKNSEADKKVLFFGRDYSDSTGIQATVSGVFADNKWHKPKQGTSLENKNFFKLNATGAWKDISISDSVG